METKNKKTIKAEIYEWVKSIVIAFLLSLLIRATTIEAFGTPTGSMQPTIGTADRMLGEKISYHFRNPHRGEIIVFVPPPQATTQKIKFLKRVIGLEGDTIEVKNSKVYVNDKSLTEPYLKEVPLYDFSKIKVPKGYLFVLGDNRNNSADSHIWVFVPRQNVVAHIIFRYWPPRRIGVL